MYFLKDVTGARIRINSTNQLFTFYEKWKANVLYYTKAKDLTGARHFRLFLGNNFASKLVRLDTTDIKKSYLGAIDKRNDNVSITYRAYSESKALMTNNYFILVDCKGRAVDASVMHQRYLQRCNNNKMLKKQHY